MGETPPTTPPTNDGNEDQLAHARTALGFKERPGFEALIIDIAYRKGPKLGLIIRNYENAVMISRLDAGSLCAEKLIVGDRLVAVDLEVAKDREQTKKLILKGFAKRKRVSFLVERPQSSDAKLWAKTAIMSSSNRTSSTAPREKHRWALMAAQQRQAAKLQAAKESRNHQNPAATNGATTAAATTTPKAQGEETGSARSAVSCNVYSSKIPKDDPQ